jgi:hypothetical protein
MMIKDLDEYLGELKVLASMLVCGGRLVVCEEDAIFFGARDNLIRFSESVIQTLNILRFSAGKSEHTFTL